MTNNLFVSGGRIVDAVNNFDATAELLIADDHIESCSKNIKKPINCKIIDAKDKLVIPGLVDSHMHVSNSIEGYYMLAHAGVSSALDMLGFEKEIVPFLEKAQTGLTLGYLYPILPNRTVSGIDPGKEELKDVITKALKEKAFGIKIIGGHFPITPEAQRKILEICNELSCYCAIHVGSTENGSNINGLAELADFAGNLPVHVAHVNSYCRGQITGNPIEEAGRALNILKKLKNAHSESYLNVINGCSGRIVDSVPLSNVTKNCLRAKNYPETASGLLKAIQDGWAQVHGKRNLETVLLPPEEGYAHYNDANNIDKTLSFAVNCPGAQIAIACAKEKDQFIVNALSTDGGRFPRNTTLAKGLALVQFGAMTMLEFVQKACYNPAQMLSLKNKGHFTPGADADICIVDPITANVDYLISGGKIVYHADQFFNVPGRLFSSK